MIAFEISVNGDRVYTCGAGDVGRLTFSLYSLGIRTDNGPSHEHTRASGCAVHPGRSLKTWPEIDDLKVGDEITVRLVEVSDCDPPEKEHPFPKRFPMAARMDKPKTNGPKQRDDEAFRLFPDGPEE